MTENVKPVYTDIWSLKDDIIKSNNDTKQEIYDIPESELISTNVKGFIINDIGNIVAQFSFFIENDQEDTHINLKVSHDGFMAGLYKKPMNILIGYGHPAGIHGLVDAKDASIITIVPEQTNNDDLIIKVENDEKLNSFGLVCVIRSVDVDLDVLNDDVREDFLESISIASVEEKDLNDIESAYNAYLKHMYIILGNDYTITDNTLIETEEIYE